MKISVQLDDFDLGAEVRALAKGNPAIGAVASFVGLVRDANDGTPVASMTLEHYPGMTEKALAEIVGQAMQRWNLIDCTVIHRYGTLAPTDQIVLVAAGGAHRGEVFAACEFIMDYLKTSAPFWKKEQTPDGTRWVEAKASDDRARDRWSGPARKTGAA